MDSEILRSAEDGKFTDFSNAVKQELKNKLSNNKDVQDYKSDFDKIQDMKAAFSQINTDFGDKPEASSEEPNSEE